MKKFSEISEAKDSDITIAFGRMNPPTVGHEKLCDMTKKVANGSEYRIYPSFTQNPAKDPLPHALKTAYMRKMFPAHKKAITVDKSAKTFIDVATILSEEGYKNFTMVAGSDRVAEFTKLLNRYNDAPDKSGKQVFKFDSIKVVSAGERDPDAEGVEGISASKMRKAAADGDFDSFKLGLPSKFTDGKKLFRDVRKYMNIREERDMGPMDAYEEMRDDYLTGKLWNIDDLVEANGIEGRVVNRGTNYIGYMDGQGKVHKAWLYDISLNERNYRKEYDNYAGRPDQIERRSSRNKARRAMGDKVVKGMDVGHRDNDPLNNSPENLRNEDPSKNRREPRLREASAPDIKKGDTIILNKAKRPYTVAGITDPKKKLPAESDKMVVNKITKSKDGRKAHLTYHDTKKRGGFAIYLDKMPDFMSVKIAEEVDLDEMSWFRKAKAKLDQMSHPKDFEKMTKSYVDAMADPKLKNKTASYIAGTIARNYDGYTGRTLMQYINKLVDDGKLPKELKSELQPESFKSFVKQISEVKQDKEVDDKKGSQPAKYYAGDMAKSTKDKRDAHFKKKKAGPAPGDSAKTKPSTHTKKFKQMFGEKLPSGADQGDYIDDFTNSDAPQFKGKSKEKRKDMAIAAYLSKNEAYQLDEKIKGLINKAEKSGMPYSILKKVYDRGMAAFKTGHRPGATPQQWAFARVNSFVTKSSGTWGKADKDLAKQVEQIEEACWVGYKQVGMKKKGNKEVPNCVPEEAELNEWGEVTEKDDKSGKELNNPTKGDVKKYKVYVKNDKGNVVKVEFGDPNMSIKRDDPARRKAFRARHNCDQKKDKTTAGYWSCKFWSGKSVTDLMKG